MSRRQGAFVYGSQAMFELALDVGVCLVIFALCGALLWWVKDSSPDY